MSRDHGLHGDEDGDEGGFVGLPGLGGVVDHLGVE